MKIDSLTIRSGGLAAAVLALSIAGLAGIAILFSGGDTAPNANQNPASPTIASPYAGGAPEKDNGNDGYDAPWNQGNRAPPVMPHWTKAGFDKYIQDKTKSEIRDEFGKPDAVYDDTDSWHYHDIDVQDPDAGTWVSGLTIRFAGIDGPKDFVVDARYN
jgi:hypothetical protein